MIIDLQENYIHVHRLLRESMLLETMSFRLIVSALISLEYIYISGFKILFVPSSSLL